MLRVQLLGEFVVERDGALVEVPGADRRLLAFLGLHPGVHRREALSARLWPYAASASARARLRTAVWSLRQHVGPEAVLASRATVGLCPQAVWVDVQEVARLVEHGQLRAAVELCGGELLSDWSEDWAQALRAEHAQRHAALLDRLAEQADAAGEVGEAVRWARLRAGLTPLDEPACCALMRRLVASGDRAGGLLVGRELVERLRRELGVAPSPGTRAALAQLRGPAPIAAPPGPRARRPLWGRAAQLSSLTAAWAAARVGRGGVCVLTGEAGIGKTRLVAELAERAENAGARVAVGAGVDVGGEAPLGLWQELCRELVARVPSPPEHANWPGELGRLTPDLAASLGRAGLPPPVAAPELERLRIYDAVLRLVEWAASGRPVLLVAEDTHRADRASMQLCAHIGRRVSALAVLFVLTRRDRPVRPEADALLADVAGRGVEVNEIDVGPLAREELAAVVRSVAALPDQDVDRIVRAAEGSPLLAVESARAVAAGSSAPPPSLRAAVRAATGSLSAPARELVEALAAAGRELSPTEIEALGLPNPPATEEQAHDSGLLRRGRGGLRFRHALLAEAARAEIRNPERRHEQVALAIERAAGPAQSQVAAEVARHLEQAGRDDLAGPLWARAGAHARSLGALPEAARFWTQAVHHAPAALRPRLELAEALGWLGQPEAFEREWQAALEQAGSPAARAQAWQRRGRILRTVVCHPRQSLTAYQRAHELLGPDTETSVRAEVLIGMAWGQASAGDPALAEALLAELGALIPDPDTATRAETGNVRVMTLIRLGRFGECVPVADEAGTAAAAAGQPVLAYAVWAHASCALVCAGDLAGALRAAEQALAATRGTTVIELPCLAARALVLARLGRHTEALATATEALALAERIDSPQPAALARHDAGLVALNAGRYRDAAELLEAALAADAKISRPGTRLARAEALARAGEPDQATAELRRAALEPVAPADQPWALVPRMARVQALIALARGHHAEARRRLNEAAAVWQRRDTPATGDELMTNFVDLGRPPVVGLVEPQRELTRIHHELAEIDTVTERTRCPTSP